MAGMRSCFKLICKNRLHLLHKSRGRPRLHVFEKPESAEVDALRSRPGGPLTAEAFEHERVEPRVEAVTTKVEVFAEKAFEACGGQVFQNGNCLPLPCKSERAGRGACCKMSFTGWLGEPVICPK